MRRGRYPAGAKSSHRHCSIVEAFGFPVYVVEGDYKNIKITTTEDLKIADIFAEEV
ncbi:MAG: 2-C-methyl-D-erythritol 4-phosphate cytidylyltransferase [Clostridia bacterium]|nr:2-C-methyl-D-erythritol 4-phosphate cytidylyltransferase [Clostridia bacterium]